jgi:hypothetical protein
MGRRVTEETLKGNHGEHFVAQMLSLSCLVRPVVGNTDVGVDLYCESVVDGEPFLHFWAQVKAYKQLPNEAVETSFSFETSHLEYWRRQPVPVLAFLVPTGDTEIRFVHVVDITMSVMEHGVSEAGTQTLKSNVDLGVPVTDRATIKNKIDSMILHHLPMVVSAQFAEKGFIFPAPKPKPEPTKVVSRHFLDRYSERISEGLRRGAAWGIMCALGAGTAISEIPKGLVGALTAFEDDLHYETHEALGLLRQAQGDIEGARRAYQHADQLIRADKTVDPTVPPWSEVIARLRGRCESLSSPQR